ncbi:MAG: RagB/SusD family nutrient uptake outer membrane protein [Bacteroidetes bacterium]|nr:RagB/SusD family nutrient uptake outer membrane protein [Bacteroidota bacterium]
MKKIVYIAALIAITGLSCSKKFIELTPISSVSTESLYKTDKDFSDALTGAYSLLRDQYQSFWQFDLPSDDARHQWPSEDILLRLDNYTYQNNEDFFYSTWGNYYGVIFRVNTILDKIAKADAAVITNKNRYIGEAKFLRALCYFDLVRIFGDVPKVTTAISDAEALKTPREKVETIYTDVILKDLQDAAGALPPKYTGADLGRATAGAATALLGKAYLTKKDFPNAETTLKKVTTMGYSLLPNYADLWDYSKDEHHSEYIFDIEYETGIQQGSVYTNMFFPRFTPAADFYQVYGGTGDSYNPSNGLFTIFESGDKRAAITASNGFTDKNGVFQSLNGSAGAKTMTLKYITPVSISGDSKANWKVIRYGDVLLMLAEALNENNKTSEAITYLNMIRTRAGVSVYTTMTQASFRTSIYLERRRELSFEGQRWFDLVRTGLAFSTLQSLGMKDYMVLFPVPLAQIQIVNNKSIFAQNPGW